jgi:hypothetical protein
MEKNGYYNPHFLVKNSYKASLRRQFFHDLLSRTRIFTIKTAGTPEETQQVIRNIGGPGGV